MIPGRKVKNLFKRHRENSLGSLLLGYATLTQTHTRISPRSRFTSYRRMTKKRLYSSRGLEVERDTFAHSKKQENYASTIRWIRTRVSFAILRSALVCLRGSRSKRRTTPNIQETDLELEVSVSFR